MRHHKAAAMAAIVVLASTAGMVHAQQASASGEVRRVDMAAGKVTIKHEAISALELPAMTLVYQAEPPGLLQDIKAGDEVKFTAQRKDGRYVITAISK